MTKSPKRTASRRTPRKAKTIEMKAEDKKPKTTPPPKQAAAIETKAETPKPAVPPAEAKAETNKSAPKTAERTSDTTSAWRGTSTSGKANEGKAEPGSAKPDQSENEPAAAKAKAEPPKLAPSASTAKGGGTGGRIAAGIVGGVLALGGATGLHYAGLLPLGGQDSDVVSAGELLVINQQIETRLSELDERIAALPVAPDQTAINTAIDNRIAALPKATDEAAAARIAELEQKTAALEEQLVGAQAELTALKDAPGNGIDGSRLASVSDKVDILAGDFARLKQDVSGAVVDPAQVAEIGTKVATVESKVGEIETSLQAVSERVGALPESVPSASALQEATDGLQQALTGQISGVSETLASVQETITGQAGRLDAVEARLADGADKRAARALIAAQLKSRIDQGQPFAETLKTFRTATGNEEAFAVIAGSADTGIPTLETLTTQFAAARKAVLDALAPVEDMSLSQRLMASAKNLVTVRPIDAPEGDTPEALLARSRAALEANDSAAALAAWNALPEEGRAAATGFGDALALRANAEAAVSQTLDSLIADTIAN